MVCGNAKLISPNSDATAARTLSRQMSVFRQGRDLQSITAAPAPRPQPQLPLRYHRTSVAELSVADLSAAVLERTGAALVGAIAKEQTKPRCQS